MFSYLDWGSNEEDNDRWLCHGLLADMCESNDHCQESISLNNGVVCEGASVGWPWLQIRVQCQYSGFITQKPIVRFNLLIQKLSNWHLTLPYHWDTCQWIFVYRSHISAMELVSLVTRIKYFSNFTRYGKIWHYNPKEPRFNISF